MRIVYLLFSVFVCLTVPAFGQTPPLCGDASPIQWDMSQAADLAEYRVYTATTAGGIDPNGQAPTWVLPHDPNPPTPGLIVYTLNQVIPDGMTYFAVTAVDLSGNESALSNELGCNLQISPDAPQNLVIGQFVP